MCVWADGMLRIEGRKMKENVHGCVALSFVSVCVQACVFVEFRTMQESKQATQPFPLSQCMPASPKPRMTKKKHKR